MEAGVARARLVFNTTHVAQHQASCQVPFFQVQSHSRHGLAAWLSNLLSSLLHA